MVKEQRRLLIVDDEQSIRQALQWILQREGYEVATASNGQEAIDKVSELNIETVLLDVKMPRMSGIEVLRQLTANWPDICVIMATAVADADTAVEAIKLGAYDYITKPFNTDNLIISLTRALEKRRLVLENRDYKLNLERKVVEQTQLLEQKIRELTALNNLFVLYLNQGFEAAETQNRLANDIIKMAEGIQTLAKEAEALKVEVPVS